jgi:hypothetical protein
VVQCITLEYMTLESVVQLRLSEDLRSELQRLADADSRPLSQYIRLLLYRHVQDDFRARGKIFQEHTPSKKEGHE